MLDLLINSEIVLREKDVVSSSLLVKYRTFDASYKQPLVSRLERMRQDGSLISSIAACQIEETHNSRNKDPWLWLIYQLEPLEWPPRLM